MGSNGPVQAEIRQNHGFDVWCTTNSTEPPKKHINRHAGHKQTDIKQKMGSNRPVQADIWQNHGFDVWCGEIVWWFVIVSVKLKLPNQVCI